MAYLAHAGFDVFSMDMTGYGRSTRPTAMNDPCNLSKEQQARFVPQLIAAPCAPSHATAMTTMGSDWNDIGAVVDHLRGLRGVDRVSIVAWSQGGPRSAGYAAKHPEKVARLVVLAPAYNRGGPLDAPNPLPAVNAAMNVRLTRTSPRTGIGRSDVPISTNRLRARPSGARCWRPIRSGPPGARVYAARRRCRHGASIRRLWRKCRRLS